ncbi:MAG: carboxyl transferase domain-containing protein [Candidatus Nanopelagicales bacterium]|nr:carboxyl transferase domain-containing protein [Candidatus Nanopelagicales bacterium]MDZ4248910.1 carboxyl transferase domain-containing protein [Candidatus Nanopelagicales bacterium]
MAPVLRSRVDTRSEDFLSNREAMQAAVAEVSRLQAAVVAGGGSADADKNARAVARHRKRGKMLPRERIEHLLDPLSPFLEMSPLAGWGTDDPLGGGLVTGIGFVSGTECMISGNDPTVKGGSQSPTAVRKGLRAMEIARANRLPMVGLTESGGADLPKQADIFVPGGASFKNLTQLSAAGIPSISLVFGSSTAGGAYLPGMSDYVVLQKNSARVYLGGPPLVKMAIDEDADEEELGGAEMHSRISGLGDYLAEDEADALRIGRQIIAHLRWRKHGGGPDRLPAPPLYDTDELAGIASADIRVPFEARDVLARLLDGSEFDEFKPLYGSTLVTGWGHLGGYPIGVLANNGILFSEESHKGAQFIQLCNRMDVPILFCQNITGFMVGTKYEQGGIIKDGAKLINAVSNSTVPHLTLMMGASYGAGNYGMSGRAYDPRFVFSWPNHRIAVMGPKQLAGVLTIVAKQKSEGAGIPFDEAAFAPMRDAFAQQVESESTALFATGRLWDDGIIDPRDTRTVLALALSAVHSSPVSGTSKFGVWRM